MMVDVSMHPGSNQSNVQEALDSLVSTAHKLNSTYAGHQPSRPK